MTGPQRVTFVTPFGSLEFQVCDGAWTGGPAFYLYVESSRRILFVGFADAPNVDLRTLGPWALAREIGADLVYAAAVPPERRDAIERWLLACFAPMLNGEAAQTAALART